MTWSQTGRVNNISLFTRCFDIIWKDQVHRGRCCWCEYNLVTWSECEGKESIDQWPKIQKHGITRSKEAEKCWARVRCSQLTSEGNSEYTIKCGNQRTSLLWKSNQTAVTPSVWNSDETGTEITGVRRKEEVSDSENRSGATTNPPGKQTLSQMTFIHRESRLQISPCKPTVYITNDPLQHLLILLLENGTLASGISSRLIHTTSCLFTLSPLRANRIAASVLLTRSFLAKADLPLLHPNSWLSERWLKTGDEAQQ